MADTKQFLTTYLKRWKMHVIWGKSFLSPSARKWFPLKEWYIGNVLVCAHFSPNLAHGTYCFCSITRLFRLKYIYYESYNLNYWLNQNWIKFCYLSPGFLNPVLSPGFLNPDLSPGFLNPGLSLGFLNPDLSPGFFNPGLSLGFLNPDLSPWFLNPDLSPEFLNPGLIPGFLNPDLSLGFLNSDLSPGFLNPALSLFLAGTEFR